MTASAFRKVTATSSYVALPDIPGKTVSILNKTGDDLFLNLAGDTDGSSEIALADGESVGVSVAANAKEIRIKSATGTTGVYVVVDTP